MPKTLSVLIPTLGRSKELIQTVNALMKQTRLPDEIIVIDQNQPSLNEVDRFLAVIPLVRHFHETEPGVSVNYNRCLKQASSDIVLYLDDDIEPEKDLIERHLENYTEKEDVHLGGVAGRVEQPSGDKEPNQIKVVGVYRKWSGKLIAHFNAKQRTWVDLAPGGNMSFYRKVLLEIEGFDSGFGGNGYFFESDGCLRVRKLGYKLIFDPRASVKHLMAPAGGARIRDKALHHYHFIKNGIRLYRRHSPHVGLPYFVVKLFLYSTAKSFYHFNFRIFKMGVLGIKRGLSQKTDLISDGLR